MESEKYLEGNMTFKPPYFENTSFLEWKNWFESYVKLIDYDLWHVISIGDYQPTKTIFGKQDNYFKIVLDKNNIAKMIIYKALPRIEYERIFFVKRQMICGSLLNFHQEKCQAKENFIYKIVENESIVDKYLVEMSTSATS